MLILNIKSVKHSQLIPLSAYLNSHITTHNDHAYLKKIGNYKQLFL